VFLLSFGLLTVFFFFFSLIDQRIEALGSGGMLQAENRRPTSVVRSTIDGISIDPNFYSFPQRYKDTYATELEHFVDMILHGVPPKVTGEDCIKTAIIADTAHESCKLGVPIKIDYSAYKF
jgi:myo-inositol 2-dehydrogenase / D-chiro-inositol 1-dehydrogenase